MITPIVVVKEKYLVIVQKKSTVIEKVFDEFSFASVFIKKAEKLGYKILLVRTFWDA